MDLQVTSLYSPGTRTPRLLGPSSTAPPADLPSDLSIPWHDPYLLHMSFLLLSTSAMAIPWLPQNCSCSDTINSKLSKHYLLSFHFLHGFYAQETCS